MGLLSAVPKFSLSVVASRMNFGTADNKPMVYVICVITNKTDMAWKDLEVDARFFNKTGTLIDAHTYHDSSTILPHDEMALRMGTTPFDSLSDYETYKIYIRSARDARSPL